MCPRSAVSLEGSLRGFAEGCSSDDRRWLRAAGDHLKRLLESGLRLAAIDFGRKISARKRLAVAELYHHVCSRNHLLHEIQGCSKAPAAGGGFNIVVVTGLGRLGGG